jgi:hypothetical protein
MVPLRISPGVSVPFPQARPFSLIISSTLLFKSFHHLMVPAAFVLGKQITVTVYLWMYLFIQILEFPETSVL